MRPVLVAACAIVIGGSTAVALAGASSRQHAITVPAIGPLVAYSISADGTHKTPLGAPGPEVDWTVLGGELSRSADGSAFQISTYDPIGTLNVGYPLMSPNLGLRNISAAVGFPGPHGGVLPSDFDGQTPSFSPDGRWIAFTVGECSYPHNCAGCQTNCVSEDVYVARAADGAFAHKVAAAGMSPTWSGDGKWLTYEGWVGTFSNGHATGVFVVRRDGKLRRRLATSGSGAVFAPRGNLVAFGCEDKDRAALCVVNKDGSDQRVIGPSSAFVWSRDGQQIAYAYDGRGDGRSPNYFARLSVVSVHGGSPKMILRQAGLGAPVDWSPDNRRIAYLATASPDDITQSVYLATLSSRRSSLLTTDVVSRSDVRWESDNTLTYITFIPQ